MNSTDIVPVLMSGGAGTRLWPTSRSDRPKQFLQLVDDSTMVEATLERLVGLATSPPLVVANFAHADLVATELERAGHAPTNMILEPFGRNTAPAAAVAALELSAGGEDPVMLLLPADHVIEDVAAFHEAVRHGANHAASGKLITFGIVPTHAETGYGYINTGPAIDDGAAVVERFVEKPDLETATGYLAAGTYLWNSGMFLFRCSAYLDALATFAPEILDACKKTLAVSLRDRGVELDAESFSASPSDSIDYAVMENTSDAVVVPLDAGWSDVGSWAALWEASPRDGDGNVLVGDVIVTGTTGSYVRSDDRLVAVVGLEDAVVVETPDAVLVTTRDKCQDVKTIVDILKEQQRLEATRSTRKDDHG